MSHLHGLSNTFEASRENEKIYGIARTRFPIRTRFRFHARNKVQRCSPQYCRCPDFHPTVVHLHLPTSLLSPLSPSTLCHVSQRRHTKNSARSPASVDRRKDLRFQTSRDRCWVPNVGLQTSRTQTVGSLSSCRLVSMGVVRLKRDDQTPDSEKTYADR